MANEKHLAKTQSAFVKTTTGFGQSEQLLEQAILPAGTLTNEAALSVYRRAYMARLTEALGETFEAVWRVLGDEGFFQTAKSFIEIEPSRSYNLSDYGHQFPTLLAQRHGEELPFLSHLARFEWSFRTVFHAPGHEPISASRLASLTVDDDAKLIFGPSVVLHDAPYSVYELWKHRKKAALNLDTFELERPEHIVLYKREHKVFTILIGPPEHRILKSLVQGDSLSSALSQPGLTASTAQVANLFQLMFNSGIILNLTTSQKDTRNE